MGRLAYIVISPRRAEQNMEGKRIQDTAGCTEIESGQIVGVPVVACPNLAAAFIIGNQQKRGLHAAFNFNYVISLSVFACRL